MDEFWHVKKNGHGPLRPFARTRASLSSFQAVLDGDDLGGLPDVGSGRQIESPYIDLFMTKTRPYQLVSATNGYFGFSAVNKKMREKGWRIFR